MRGKYIVLFNDGTSDWVYAEDKSEAYEIALDRFEKQIERGRGNEKALVSGTVHQKT